jgi:site-specific DNA recombinase
MTTKPTSLHADRARGIIRGYIRVSHPDQVRDGVSLETQTDLITRFGAYKGFVVQEIVCDPGISGRVLEDRPNLVAVLGRLKKKEHFVVASLSRLARNLKETMEIYSLIQERGAFFVSLDMDINTNTAIGRLIFQILASLAEFESNQTSERVIAGLATVRANGKLQTRPRYGWQSPGKGLQHIPHVEQQQSIQIIVNIYIACHRLYNTCRMAKELNERKIPTHSKANKWYPNRVKQILTENLADYNPEGESDTESDSGSESEESKIDYC